MAGLSVVGKSVTRTDNLEKVTGAARYTSDVELHLPGLLYGKILHSPYPHARILDIDTSQAERLPGVKIVLTGKDMLPARVGRCVADRHLLARERVRFVGDAVAAVAADTPETAEEALQLIKVEYQELPAVFDAEEAMRPDYPVVLHPDLTNYERLLFAYLGQDLPGPNVHSHHKIRRGNMDEGFRKADLIIENRFSVPRIVHCQLEPYNSYAYVESDGTLNIWSSIHQLFSATQWLICQLFGLPPSKVRIRSEYMGGNFGAQPQSERFAALLALRTGKPVRVTFTREECFIDGLNRFSTVTYIKDGVRSDGTLLAREIKVICNSGAYTNYTPLMVRNAAFGLSRYRTPNLKWDSYGVYTNEPCSGPFRGFGVPELIWTLEQQMDIIADKLGIDPVDFRKKNIVREGEENVRGEIAHSIGAQECLDEVARWIGWGKSSPPSSGSLRVGKGLALGNQYCLGYLSAATVKVYGDATIEVRHGAEEVGQGVNTVVSQITAEEFNIPTDKVKLVWGDTARVPYDFGSVSSRTTFTTGNAVRLACQDAKRQMFELAAAKLEVTPQDLETKEGKIYSGQSPERVITIADLFLPGDVGCLPEGGELLGRATFIKAVGGEDPETGQGKILVAFYICGAQAAEVAVDIETGEVEVLRFDSAFDMGQPINPKLCEGQMEGGAGMGIGGALFEEMVMNKGRVLNPNFTDYKLPSFADIPAGDNMSSMIAAVPQRDGPFGAKGLGEGTIGPAAAAIANAVYNAVGVRIKDLPITPEKILSALRQDKRE